MTVSSVLVTAAGSIIGQGIIKCLNLANKKNSGMSYQIIAADASPRAAGLYRAYEGVLVPPASSQDYLDSIIKTCVKKKIKAIFVGSDEESGPLAMAKEEVENRSGAKVVTNPPPIIATAGDKWKTFEFLIRNGLPCADSALPGNIGEFVKKHPFPIVVKPREGHGSLHFYIVHNNNELESAMKDIERSGWRPMLQEYLEGEDTEFTTGVTVSNAGHVMSSIAMRKILKSGQTYKAFIDDYREVREYAEETALKMGVRGPVNIQSKISEGVPKIFEINARFSATVPIRAVAGINEPDIVFRNIVLGEDGRASDYEKLVCMRYWNEVYVKQDAYENAVRRGLVTGTESFIPDYF